MKMKVEIGGKDYEAALTHTIDISIPVKFEGAQISAFGNAHAQAKAYEAGSFIGDVRRGGSCNCELYTFSPHLNGTHTECVGHITDARIAVKDAVQDSFIPAALVTINPVMGAESYTPAVKADDAVITRGALEAALKNIPGGFTDALIIRTQPNGPEKISRDYNTAMPPFFSHEAMRLIVDMGARHLLVDMPSVDRLDDDGHLSNHRLFWGVAPGVRDAAPSTKTITELIYVPDAVADGAYLLNLQVAAFDADAAPSRPVLYEVKSC